ncbi:hypothetical protein FS837_003413 [Tulasnella sp. UAMH 9824]|nr:hypothetical protein FS837_003413 [Tulasnella sp. UAMH 9824]
MVASVTIAQVKANGSMKWDAKNAYRAELLECIRAFKCPEGLAEEDLDAINVEVTAWSSTHAQDFATNYGSYAETYSIMSMVCKLHPGPDSEPQRLKGFALQPTLFDLPGAQAILESNMNATLKTFKLFPLLFVNACDGSQGIFGELGLPYDELVPGMV